MTSIEFTVRGIPTPQGSKKGFNHPKTGKVVMVESAGQKLKSWREDVRHTASATVTEPLAGAVSVEIVFRLPRPPHGEYPAAPGPCGEAGRGQADPGDAGYSPCGGVYLDDSQVVDVRGRKVYADEGLPGADIHISTV